MREMPKLFWLVAPLCVVLVSTQASAQSTPWETSTAAGLQAYQQGRYSEAEEYFSAALKGAESFGPEDPRLATSLNNLAELYRTQSKYAQAEPLYERSLAIREKALGSEHPNVARSLENYAALLRKVNRDAEASKMEARAKAIREKSRVRTPWETVRSWNDALSDGDRSLALKLTWSTTTSTKYWRTVGGVEGLIQIYSRTRDRIGRSICSLLDQHIEGTSAQVHYSCRYADGSEKEWIDELRLEESAWKVAPQFVEVEPRPQVIRKVKAKYTKKARKAGIQGTVILELEIWPDGKGHNIRVIRSLDSGLDRNAVEAVKKWRFTLGKKDGKPGKVRVNVAVDFSFL